MKNYYQILGISKTATSSEIRKAYLKKAKEYHPDVNKSDQAETLFKEIQEAYNILSNTSQKINYDNQSYQTSNNQPYTNWAEYYRQQAEQQQKQQYREQQKTYTRTESNTQKEKESIVEEDLNNQSSVLIFLIVLLVVVMAIVVYYVGILSSLILGYMIVLLYQIYVRGNQKH